MNLEIVKYSLILGLMNAISAFAIDMYLPAMPTMASDLGAPISSAQLTLTVYFLAFGVAQLFWGPLSDMFGRKLPIYLGLGLFFAASIGCAYAQDIETLIVLRFIQGVAAAGPMSIPRAIIRDLYTGQKATRMMSTLMLVFSVSPMLAPLLGSFVMEPFGWRGVFFAIAACTILSLVMVGTLLPETLKPSDRRPFDMRTMFQSFGILLKDMNYLSLTFIGGLGMASFFTFLGSASFVYMEHFGLDPTQFAIAFAANAAGFFVTSQFAANLMGIAGPKKLIFVATIGYAIMVGGLLSIFALGMGTLPIMIAMFIVANGFMGLIIPTSMVLALEDHGPIAGAAASLGGTLQMLSGSLAMAISAMFFDGTPVPMLVVIVACALGALALAIMSNRRGTPAIAE
ncbi:multidrug effflux MFS transporter [Maritalea porphyrae]|uniref:Bcr/CflA family efflux transporter n=1 Tax=Maritalea porphyrae TaxID=880732 RepID=A0ABQ5UQH5_9HYPH|nr:multidrug effflux MFS transporter [Maritalea porphyrae]GLQ16611.1 Bcr/CflA family drug resistance efflux transporter [Maritalea porphyrae]